MKIRKDKPSKYRLQLLSAYKSKILGIRNYNSTKTEFDSSDLTNNKMLARFLEEVFTGESDITPAGLAFLESYYGEMKKVAKIKISQETSFASHSRIKKAKMVKDCVEWLASITPMETREFIESSRGNINENSKLKDSLLPPK